MEIWCRTSYRSLTIHSIEKLLWNCYQPMDLTAIFTNLSQHCVLRFFLVLRLEMPELHGCFFCKQYKLLDFLRLVALPPLIFLTPEPGLVCQANHPVIISYINTFKVTNKVTLHKLTRETFWSPPLNLLIRPILSITNDQNVCRPTLFT